MKPANLLRGDFHLARTEGDQGYAEAAERMVELARQQPGFLGVDSIRGKTGRDYHFVLGERGGDSGLARS
jgi:antibiotic biosynthesis monooxygenase (ABM) superfamily enzyme